MKRLSHNRKFIILAFFIPSFILLSVSCVYAYLVGSAMGEGRELIDCVFQRNFLLYCPGCGGSRSLYYFMRLDIIKAFIYYPALPYSAVVLLVADIKALMSFIKDDLSYIRNFKNIYLILIPIIILLNFLVRNVLLFLGIDYIGDIASLFV